MSRWIVIAFLIITSIQSAGCLAIDAIELGQIVGQEMQSEAQQQAAAQHAAEHPFGY